MILAGWVFPPNQETWHAGMMCLYELKPPAAGINFELRGKMKRETSSVECEMNEYETTVFHLPSLLNVGHSQDLRNVLDQRNGILVASLISVLSVKQLVVISFRKHS